jgi:hypothetical protein
MVNPGSAAPPSGACAKTRTHPLVAARSWHEPDTCVKPNEQTGQACPAVPLLPDRPRRTTDPALRWDDSDFGAGVIRLRQQIQRVRGQLQLGPVKTTRASGLSRCLNSPCR